MCAVPLDPKRITLGNGLTLSYVDRGDRSAPVVVLVPGITDSWRTYGRVLPLLPHALRTLVPSMRGHGDSDKPETGYTPGDFAADLGEFLDALEVERAVVVGHSSSGLVAQRFAIGNPERTTGVVLISAFTAFRGNEKAAEFARTTVAVLQDPISPEFAREWVVGTSGRPVPPSFLDAMVEDVLKVPAHVWRAGVEGMLEVDHTAELPMIRAPALLVWGDQDTLIGRETQDAMVSSIPDAELVVYEGIGHSPHWEDPERFAADLVTLVERRT